MVRTVFYSALLLATISLSFVFNGTTIVADEGLWARQAEWVATGNPQEFDLRQAYGHPGGPLIEAGIALHAAGLPYETALALFQVIAGALLIAGIACMTYLLRRSALWTFGALGILLCNPFYFEMTPPSFLAALLAALLALLTLSLYEKPHTDTPLASRLLFWSMAAGALAATRADIGGILDVTFTVVLGARYGWRRALEALVLAFAWFSVFDPFMWFMPLAHVRGIFTKMFVHYTGSLITGTVPLSMLISFCARALISFALGCIFLFRPKASLPRAFSGALVGASALVFVVLVTSRFDTLRYFMPLVFIWEVFLPLLVKEMLSGLRLGRLPATSAERIRSYLATGVVAFLVVVPSTTFIWYLIATLSIAAHGHPL